MADQPTSIVDSRPPEPRSRAVDDLAYFLPMGVFLLFTWIGGTWEQYYPASYIVKAVLVTILLILFWRSYTKIRWNYWWLGILVGIVGIVQWVGMEKLLPNYPKMSHSVAYNPFEHFTPAHAWGFIAVRWASASLLVPVMEELFWRDFLWRQIIAPNDFKLAGVGEWDWKAFLMVALIFGAGVHIEWLTAIVWGLMIGGLLVYTRSLGACIIAHGVTNFLLGLYVLETGHWQFW